MKYMPLIILAVACGIVAAGHLTYSWASTDQPLPVEPSGEIDKHTNHGDYNPPGPWFTPPDFDTLGEYGDYVHFRNGLKPIFVTELDGAVKLAWYPHREGTPVLPYHAAGYEIHIKRADSSSAPTFVAQLLRDDHTNYGEYTISNLDNGVEYEIILTVFARFNPAHITDPNWIDDDHDVGFGGVKATPVGAPSPPSNFHYTGGYSGTVVLHWDDPASDGGMPITEYIVMYRIGMVNPFTMLATVPPVQGYIDHEHRAEGLTNGMPYQFAVHAKNSVGTGQSAVITATPAGSPGAPLNFEANLSSNQDNVIVLSWDAPDDNGSTINYYGIHYRSDDDRSSKWLAGPPHPSTLYMFDSPDYENEIEFTIFASSSHGRGPVATTTLTKPG